MEEAKKQVEIVESQLRSMKEEFEQSIALLMKRDWELNVTKERLAEKEGELVEKVGEPESAAPSGSAQPWIEDLKTLLARLKANSRYLTNRIKKASSS
jgi:hypothetical protein